MFLLTAYFFKARPGCTSPCNISVVNIPMYVKAIQSKKRMFIYIGLYLIQQPNILAILLSIYLMFFHLVILLGILNILIVLFHYYLYLILVKGAEYLPFCQVIEFNILLQLQTYANSNNYHILMIDISCNSFIANVVFSCHHSILLSRSSYLP